MKAILSLIPLLSLSVPSLASAADLKLADERFKLVFNRYVCSSFEEKGIEGPAGLTAQEIVFERLSIDRQLSNALVVASFREGEALCRYTALLSRDRAAKALGLARSSAYSMDEGVDCSAGKARVDALLASAPYRLTEGPHRFLSIEIPAPGSDKPCGEGKSSVQVVFQRIFRR